MSVMVLGLDPAFRNFGWCVVELMADGERVVEMGVLETKKSTKKQNVHVASDDYRCAKALGVSLRSIIEDNDVHAVCAESRLGAVKGARAASTSGYAWGVLAGVLSCTPVPLVQASPTEIKRAVCRSKTASKADVERALLDFFHEEPYTSPGIEAFILATAKRTKIREHAFDALGAVVACLDSEVIRAIRPRAWVEQVAREGAEMRRKIEQATEGMHSIHEPSICGGCVKGPGYVHSCGKPPGMLTRGGVS